MVMVTMNLTVTMMVGLETLMLPLTVMVKLAMPVLVR